MTICLLPETLASSIAVGEVVERPALVFKELVENSLDVRATRIEISLRDGGSCIPVTDDGAGMARDECSVARDGGHRLIPASTIMAVLLMWSSSSPISKNSLAAGRNGRSLPLRHAVITRPLDNAGCESAPLLSCAP